MAAISGPGLCKNGDRPMSKKLRAPATSVVSGSVPVRVRLKRVNCNHAIPYPPDGQAREWWQRIDARLCNPGRSATTPKERGLPSCPCRACACERGRPSAHWECEEGRQPEGRGPGQLRQAAGGPTRPTVAGFEEE